MTARERPMHCGHCGTVLATAPVDAIRHCPHCGTPHTRRNLSRKHFPITIRLYSGTTGELLWSRAVTLDEARNLAEVEIPGYLGTEHHPVRAAIEYADGTTKIGGMS